MITRVGHVFSHFEHAGEEEVLAAACPSQLERRIRGAFRLGFSAHTSLAIKALHNPKVANAENPRISQPLNDLQSYLTMSIYNR